MSTNCPKDVEKMSETCPKLSKGAGNTIFGHFLDNFCVFWSMLLIGDSVSKRARATALPGPSLGRGGGFDDPGGTPRTTTGPPLLACVKKPQTPQKGENKKKERVDQNTCRLESRKRASEGASSLKPPEYRGEIRKSAKTHGAQKGTPDKTPERKDARPDGR